MKRTLLVLLCLLPLVAVADVRLELTNEVHVPWSQADADDEFKTTEGATPIISLQLPNGAYNASWNATIKEVPPLLWKRIGGGGRSIYRTNCLATAGTFQLANGDTFTTNDCDSTITFNRTEGRLIDMHVSVELRNAEAANGAAAELSDYNGQSRATR